MSISRGTSLSRLLSNNETLTIRVSARKAAAALAATCFIAGLWAGVMLQPAWRYVREQLVIRRDHAAAMKPWIEQARAAAATYESAKPGDIVDWCIDHPSKDFSYLAGKQSQPILWQDDAAAPITPGTKSACQRMIARVVSREPQGLKLEFLGQP